MAGRHSEFGLLRAARRGAAGIARLLLLAFCLQLALPLVGGRDLAQANAAEARLQADIAASLCHEGSFQSDPAPPPGQEPGLGHCVFCLPLAAAGVATEPAAILPMRAFVLAGGSSPLHDQRPDSLRPASQRSRAPPAILV